MAAACADGADVARGRRGEGEFRNARRRALNRIALHLGIADDQHRTAGRRHRDVVRAHRGLGEMAERQRLVVPLGVVANQGAQVLRAMQRLHAGPAPRAVGVIADHHIDRHAIDVGVVDGHRGMLQPDVAVDQRHHRLALDLGVAVRHRDGRFFVAAVRNSGILLSP